MGLLRKGRLVSPVLLIGIAVAAGFAKPPLSAASPAQLDPISSGCVSCHDGTAGSPVSFCLLTQGGEGAGGHVVSAAYAAFAANNRRLRPAGSLPPELVLHEGRITCETCHGGDPHRRPLAIDNSGSALCRACHLN